MSARANRRSVDTKWQADAWWFHFFRSLIDGGQLAEMSGAACKIYLVVKSHANYSNGLGGPALTTIAKKAGVSLATVKRELAYLLKTGLICKRKSGRNNVYQAIEHFPFTDAEGTSIAVGRWGYVPGEVKAATEELKKTVETQSLNSAVMIRINKLQLQIVEHGGQGIQNGDINLEAMPAELREPLERLLVRHLKHAAKSNE